MAATIDTFRYREVRRYGFPYVDKSTEHFQLIRLHIVEAGIYFISAPVLGALAVARFDYAPASERWRVFDMDEAVHFHTLGSFADIHGYILAARTLADALDSARGYITDALAIHALYGRVDSWPRAWRGSDVEEITAALGASDYRGVLRHGQRWLLVEIPAGARSVHGIDMPEWRAFRLGSDGRPHSEGMRAGYSLAGYASGFTSYEECVQWLEAEAAPESGHIYVEGERLLIAYIPARGYCLYRAPYVRPCDTGFISFASAESYARGHYREAWRGRWHEAPDILAGVTRYDTTDFHDVSALSRLESIISEHLYRYAGHYAEAPALEVTGWPVHMFAEATGFAPYGFRALPAGHYVEPVRLDIPAVAYQVNVDSRYVRTLAESARGAVTIERYGEICGRYPVTLAVGFDDRIGEWRATEPVAFAVLYTEAERAGARAVLGGIYATEAEAKRAVVWRALGWLKESLDTGAAGQREADTLAAIAGAPHLACQYLIAAAWLGDAGAPVEIVRTPAGHGRASGAYEAGQEAQALYEAWLYAHAEAEPLMTYGERAYTAALEAARMAGRLA